MRSSRLSGDLRPIVSVTVLLLALLVSGRPAYANDGDGGWSNPLVAPSGDSGRPEVVLMVDRVGEYVTGPGAPAWLRQCRWRAWSLLEKEAHYAQAFSGSAPSADELRGRGEDPEEAWGVVTCPATADTIAVRSDISFTGVLSTWRIDDGLPRLVLDYAIARAYASVELPVQVGDSAPFGDERAPMITQLPTWLWIDDAIWQPVSASTPPLFGVVATVTATPVRVTFQGDDEFVDCGANLGPPYDFNRQSERQSSPCTLTWRNSSAVGDWSLTSTVTWAATWACNTGCGTGSLPPFTVTNTRPVRVAELQAVLLPAPTD